MKLKNYALLKDIETGDFTVTTTPRAYNNPHHRISMYNELATKLAVEGKLQPSALMFGDVSCEYVFSKKEGIVKIGFTPVAKIYPHPTADSVPIDTAGRPLFLAPYPTLSTPYRNLLQLRDIVYSIKDHIIWKFL